jgi:PII-like signaling protein
MGYGSNSRIHTAKVLRLSEDMPLVIEIVDTEEKINLFIPVVEEIFEESNAGGLITIEAAEIIKYSSTN